MQDFDLYAGTSGWSFDDWKGRFYPKGYYTNSKHLGYYSARFNATEINATYYRFMKDQTVQGWYNKTPEAFIFAVKMHRYFTHTKRLHVDEQVQQRMDWFLRQNQGLQEKKGPVLVQLPPSLKKDVPLLQNWLEQMPEYRYAIEFRHESWLDDQALQTLHNYKAALVFSHTPKWRSTLQATTDIAYLRFHGPSEFATSRYDEDQLRQFAREILALPDHVKKVYAFFNNSYQAFAAENAQSLIKYLKEEKRPAPM